MLDKCKVCQNLSYGKACAWEHNGDAKDCPVPNDYIVLQEHDKKIRTKTIEELKQLVSKAAYREIQMISMEMLWDILNKM